MVGGLPVAVGAAQWIAVAGGAIVDGSRARAVARVPLFRARPFSRLRTLGQFVAPLTPGGFAAEVGSVAVVATMFGAGAFWPCHFISPLCLCDG